MIVFMLIGLCVTWVVFLGCGGYATKQLCTGEWKDNPQEFAVVVVAFIIALLAIIVAA